MTQDNIKMALNQLANLLHIKPQTIQELADKHGIIEKRQRKIFCFPFLYVCIMLMLKGFFRHKDRKHFYRKLFGIIVSTNAFSDRLSEIPPAFFRDLIKEITPQLNQIGSPKQREQLKTYLRHILIEDGTTYSVNKRLLSVFGKGVGRGENSSLKLYMAYNVAGESRFKAIIRKGNHADKSRATQPVSASLELRDRGWFSMALFKKWREQGRYFISRIKENFDPVIVDVQQGDINWVGKHLRDIDWEQYRGEVTLLIQPNKVKGKILKIKDKPFTLLLKGKFTRQKWFWYLVDMPKAEKLSFDDVHQLYRVRWSIEENFREMKACLGSNDLNGLTNENCVVNQVYLVLIGWLAIKSFVKLVAEVNRKSYDGFRIDNILKGSASEEFFQLLLSYIQNGIISKAELKRKSSGLIEFWYSHARAHSQKKRLTGKAIGRLCCA